MNSVRLFSFIFMMTRCERSLLIGCAWNSLGDRDVAGHCFAHSAFYLKLY